MSTNNVTPENCTVPDHPADARAGRITGPHLALDATGACYEYYRCEDCGLESTDERLQTDGCFRCA